MPIGLLGHLGGIDQFSVENDIALFSFLLPLGHTMTDILPKSFAALLGGFPPEFPYLQLVLELCFAIPHQSVFNTQTERIHLRDQKAIFLQTMPDLKQ